MEKPQPSAEQLEKILAEAVEQVGLGHSLKAEKTLTKLIRSLSAEAKLLHLSRLTHASEQFLPSHKARHRRLVGWINFTERVPISLPSPPILADPNPRTDPSTGEGARNVESAETQFEALVAEMEPRGFTRSDQVSAYIKKHHPGKRYGLIAGDLVLEENGQQWIYPYGIDPKYYARLCQRLGLGNKGSNAVPIDFTPYGS